MSRSGLKSAFYVTHRQAACLVRIHVLTTHHSPLKVHMFEEREAAALYRRLSYAVKSAFYVSSSDAAHYAKLHALLTDHSQLQVSIFTGREMA